MGEQFLGESLIFIISQPRAGSTMLQRVLAGNERVHTSAETWLMLHPIYARREKGLHVEYVAWLARRALEDFLEHYAGGEETYLEAVRAYAGVLYGRALQNAGKQVFVDKTPRYYLVIPELHRIFPKAKFLMLLRNPLAVLASIMSTWLEGNVLNLWRHRDDLLLAPRLILEGIDALGEDAIVARYEELVTDPEEGFGRLCGQLGVAFSPDMLAYGDREPLKGMHGDQVGVYRHATPCPDNRDKWRSLADTDQTRHFALAYLESLGRDMVERMGYPYDELRQPLAAAGPVRSRAVVPWEAAIRYRGGWSRRDRLRVNRALALREKGALRGTVSFVLGNLRPLLRSLFPG